MTLGNEGEGEQSMLATSCLIIHCSSFSGLGGPEHSTENVGMLHVATSNVGMSDRLSDWSDEVWESMLE